MVAEYKIKVKADNRPSDDLIEVAPFGRVKNGETFTAILSSKEASRYEAQPRLQVSKTKRKKSDMSDDDQMAWDAVVAEEEQEEAVERMAEELAENTAVAGEGEGNPPPEPADTEGGEG